MAAKTLDERVLVMHRYRDDPEGYVPRGEYVVAYDAPRSKKLKEIRVFPAGGGSEAYAFRQGFVAGLKEAG